MLLYCTEYIIHIFCAIQQHSDVFLKFIHFFIQIIIYLFSSILLIIFKEKNTLAHPYKFIYLFSNLFHYLLALCIVRSAELMNRWELCVEEVAMRRRLKGNGYIYRT